MARTEIETERVYQTKNGTFVSITVEARGDHFVDVGYEVEEAINSINTPGSWEPK